MSDYKDKVSTMCHLISGIKKAADITSLFNDHSGLMDVLAPLELDLWKAVKANKSIPVILTQGGKFEISVKDVIEIFEEQKTFGDVFRLHCSSVALHQCTSKIGSKPYAVSFFSVSALTSTVQVTCRAIINGTRNAVSAYQSGPGTLTEIPRDYRFAMASRNWKNVTKDKGGPFVYQMVSGTKDVLRWDVVHISNFQWKTLEVVNNRETEVPKQAQPTTKLVVSVASANTSVSEFAHHSKFDFITKVCGASVMTADGVYIDNVGYFTQDKIIVDDHDHTFEVDFSKADANVYPEISYVFVRDGKSYFIIANPSLYSISHKFGMSEIAFLTANEIRIPSAYTNASNGVYTLPSNNFKERVQEILDDDPEYQANLRRWDKDPDEKLTFMESVKDKIDQFVQLINGLVRHVCSLIQAAGDFIKSIYDDTNLYFARKVKMAIKALDIGPLIATMLMEKQLVDSGWFERTSSWMSYAMRIVLMAIPYVLACDFLAYDLLDVDLCALSAENNGLGYDYACQEGFGKFLFSVLSSVLCTSSATVEPDENDDTEDSFSETSEVEGEFEPQAHDFSENTWFGSVVAAAVAMAGCVLPFDDSQLMGISKKLRSAMVAGSFAALTMTAAWELLPETFKIVVRSNMGLVDKYHDIKLDIKYISDRVAAGDYTNPILMTNYYHRLSMDKVQLINESTTKRYTLEIARLIQLIDRLVKAMSELEGSCDDTDRPVPFFLKMYGASGLGKSTLMRIINVELVRSITKDASLSPKAARKHIYSKNEAEKYWSCYHDQVLTTFDDYGAFRATSAEDSIAVQMLTLASCETKILNMAGTDMASGRKGQRFTSRVITATTNNPVPNLTHLEHPDAYFRRVTMLIKMVKKGEAFTSDKGKVDNTNIVKKKDFSHCDWYICSYVGNGSQRQIVALEKITDVVHLLKKIWASYQIFINSNYDTTSIPSMTDYYTDPKWKYTITDEKITFRDDEGNVKEFTFDERPSEREAILDSSTEEVESISASPLIAPKSITKAILSAVAMVAAGFGLYLLYDKFNTFQLQTWSDDPYEKEVEQYNRKANNTKRDKQKIDFGKQNGYSWTSRGWAKNGQLVSQMKALELEERFLTQGGSDVFQSAVMKKACAGLQSIDGGFIHSVSVVGGSLILMPNHFTKTLKTGNHYLYRYKSSSGQYQRDPAPYFINFDDMSQYRILTDENDPDIQLDLAICKLGVPDHLRLPNCLDKYVSSYDFDCVCLPNTHLVGLYNGTYTETPVRNVHFKQVISTTHDEPEYAVESFWYESVSMIKGRTRQGDCGRILVSPYNNGTILGLHQGSYHITARSQYITREKLLALAIEFDYKLVQNLSANDKFEQQGGSDTSVIEEIDFTKEPEISDCFRGYKFFYDRTSHHNIVEKFHNVWNVNDVAPMCELPENNPAVRLVNTITKSELMLTSPDKTEFRPSVISQYDGPWGESDMEPAPLRGMFPDPKDPDVLRPVSYISIDKAKLCDFKITKYERSLLRNWLLAFLTDVNSEGVKQNYTLKEALNGVELDNNGEPVEGTRFGNSIDMASSMGYILGKILKNKREVVDSSGRIKDFVRDENDRNLLEDMCNERIECAKVNMIPWFSYFTIIKKDEPRQKPVKGTRLVYGGPPDLWVVTQAYFGSFHAHSKKFIGRNGPQVGINPLGSDWHALALNLLKVRKIWDGDYSGFDHCGDLQIWSIIADVINDWYTVCTGYEDDEANRIRKVLLLEMPWARYVIFDAIVQRIGCLPSGSLLTSCMGSLINISYWMLFIIRHKPSNVRLKYTAEELNELFVLCVYSDDNVVGCIDEFYSWFNPDAFAAWIMKYGPRYTTVDKKDCGHRPKPISEIEFLKRSFVRESDGQYWYSKLDYSSCKRMIQWTHRPSEFDMNIRSFMTEILRYGRKDYENYRKAFLSVNNMIQFMNDPAILARTFDDMVNITMYPEYNKCLSVTDDVKSIYVYTLNLSSKFSNGEARSCGSKRKRRTVRRTVAHCQTDN